MDGSMPGSALPHYNMENVLDYRNVWQSKVVILKEGNEEFERQCIEVSWIEMRLYYEKRLHIGIQFWG